MAYSIILIFGALAAARGLPYTPECGYKSCQVTDPNVLNVHIVPHTHDDVGWLKTVDQYYYGSRNNIQKAGVQYILDTVVKELWEDPKRRFMYVETAFFWKWWVRQSEEVQNKVRVLVDEERLQFVGGAWSMNDEAAVHYHSTIDQFTWGLSKINETFGPCALPRVGWQIDPFGHSREFASLLAGMGYDGLFLGRIDYQDKMARLREKRMEMIWRGDDELGASSDIFTGVLYNTYSPPPGFCFDILCADEPIIDDPASPDYNVDKKIEDFIKYVKSQAKSYRTNNVIITMGGDFTYQEASMWYTNLDKLIQYANLKAAKDNLNIKLFYSTPNCYLKAVKDAGPTLPTKTDDFFPYASDPNSYWTGYFTSRPTTKFFERQGNDYLQMAKQLQVLSDLPKHNIFVLNELKSAMGVMQHHDAITGTEKQHVAHDYERMLTQAVDDSLIIPRQAFNKLSQGSAAPLLSYDRCRLNESSCYTLENSDNFVVTLYNPLAWKVNHPVRIPIKNAQYEVYAPNGDKIDSQILEIPQLVLDIPTRQSEATHEIVFIAYLKPLMVKSFYVKKINSNRIKRNSFTVDMPRDNNNIDYKLNERYINVGTDNKMSERSDLPRFGRSKEFDDHVKSLITMIKGLRDDTLKNNAVFNENNINDSKFKIITKGSRDGKVFQDGVEGRVNDNERDITKFAQYDDMMGDDPMTVEKLESYFKLDNEIIQIHIDNVSGDVQSIKTHGIDTNLTVNFFYYPGCVGNNESPENRSSGAYIFRPNATNPIPINKSDFKTINGKVVKELRTSFDSVHSSLRLYTGLDYIELDYVIGPIDIQDGVGKEYIIKYATDIINNGEFYTDSNGRQSLKRKLNYRPQYNVSLAEPVGGNYYPISNNIYLKDGDKRLTVLTDRSVGGSSLVEGEIELMLHRRLLHDDAFGVDEALNETAFNKGLVVKGVHRIVLSNTNEGKAIKELDLQPLIFVSNAKDVDLNEWLKLKNCYSWLNKMPNNVHLLTLEPWGEKFLLRLENFGGDVVEIDLAKIFKNIKVLGFKETVLSANKWLDNRKWEWNKEGMNDEYSDCSNLTDNGTVIKLKPKQIRSFIMDYEYEG